PFDLSSLNDDEKLHFLLVFNSISFCYWGEPKWTINYKGKQIDGSFGMIAAIKRSIDSEIPIFNAEFLSNISKKDFDLILQGNTQIPLFEERLKIIHEVGSVLVNKFQGKFSNIIKKAENDSIKLLNLIVNNFPSFNDFSVFSGKEVYFYKRAQLLVADIYQVFNGKNYGNLKNITELTACADYKLPQALLKLGIFLYSPQLANKINAKIQIPKNSKEEIEIRANTIWAVELIKQEIKKKIKDIESIHVNDHLWLSTQIKSPNNKPYHRTTTTNY
ncbi:MAG: queuosine salvage family protein, partial [Nanoarchaeota archaeon]